MFFQSKIRHITSSLLSAGCSIVVALPVMAISDGDLQRAIIDARALGDEGATVRTYGSTAVVGAYLTTKDDPNSCKAKGILVAKTLLDRVKTLTLVRCQFFVPGSTTQYIGVDVNEGAISSFEAGRTTMPRFYASIPVTDTRIKTAPRSVSATRSGSASGDENSLAAKFNLNLQGEIDKPRRLEQVHIFEILANRSVPASKLAEAARLFNLEQPAINRGNIKEYQDRANDCSVMLDALVRQSDQVISSKRTSFVKAGPCLADRETIFQSIQNLKSSSTNQAEVERLEARFKSVEGMVGVSSEELLKLAIDSLKSEMRRVQP